jgi:hypothetical protein
MENKCCTRKVNTGSGETSLCNTVEDTIRWYFCKAQIVAAEITPVI